MQIFLPIPNIAAASILDNTRLNKQITEGRQVLDCLSGKSTGWIHHPAVKMWRGYENILRQYVFYAYSTWISRGFKYKHKIEKENLTFPIKFPPWWGVKQLYDSHKSRLLLKGEIDVLRDRINIYIGKRGRSNILSMEIFHKKLNQLSYNEVKYFNELLDKKDVAKSKFKNYYLKYYWNIEIGLPYWWPKEYL